MNTLITNPMLDQATDALKAHRTGRSGGCTCGSTTPVHRHHAEVVADAIAPPLVAEIMELLGAFVEQPSDEADRTDCLCTDADRAFFPYVSPSCPRHQPQN